MRRRRSVLFESTRIDLRFMVSVIAYFKESSRQLETPNGRKKLATKWAHSAEFALQAMLNDRRGSSNAENQKCLVQIELPCDMRPIQQNKGRELLVKIPDILMHRPSLTNVWIACF